MKNILFMIIFCWITVCQANPVVSENGLYFDGKHLGQWSSELPLPSCSSCRVDDDIDYRPDGPIRFIRLWDRRGGLVFMSGHAVRPGFQLPLLAKKINVNIRDNKPGITLIFDSGLTLNINKGDKHQFQLDDTEFIFYLVGVHRLDKQGSQHHSQPVYEQPELAIDFSILIK